MGEGTLRDRLAASSLCDGDLILFIDDTLEEAPFDFLKHPLLIDFKDYWKPDTPSNIQKIGLSFTDTWGLESIAVNAAILLSPFTRFGDLYLPTPSYWPGDGYLHRVSRFYKDTAGIINILNSDEKLKEQRGYAQLLEVDSKNPLRK